MIVEAFLDNFERFFGVPERIPELRDLVVQLAVRGKLVPQDPNDEPAPEELKAVEAERRRLASEGAVKRARRLQPIEPSEAPWVVPATWLWERFGNLAQYSAGRTPSTKNAEFWSLGREGHPWISIADMPDGGVVQDTAKRITQKAADEVFKGPPVERDTLLMSFKLTLGKVSYAGIPAYHNEAIISIYPHHGLAAGYLFKTLPVLAQLGQSKAAIKGKTLNMTSLGLLCVPLPPLAEQKRIVAKVDQLMTLCDDLEAKLQQAQTDADNLLASIVHEMTNPSDPK